MLQFNEFIGKETLSREYKEFSLFKKSLEIDIHQAEKYCCNKKFEFNQSVISNLKRYIKEYIPKYACGFWNSGIEESELFIGVNDYGLVKGIPYKGNINIEYINIKLKETLDHYIKTDISPYIRPDIEPKIEFEIINVIPPNIPDEEVHEDYIEYLNKKKIFLKKYNDFLKKIDDWKEKYSILNLKLVDIVNNPSTRNQLKEYIKINDENNPVYQLLETDFKLEQISGLEMKNVKLDKNNAYYWVTTFKDSIVNEYKKSKPIFNTYFSRSNTPFNLLIGVSEMIPFWMNYNSDMNLFILRIILKCKKSQISFCYYDPCVDRWLKCKRVIEKDQPVCLPI